MGALVRADGTVQMDAIDRLVECARTASRPAHRLAPTIASLMTQSGVAPLHQSPQRPAPAKPKANGRPAPPVRSPAPFPAGVGLQQAEVLREQVIDLERRVAETRQQLTASQAQVEALKAQFAAEQTNAAQRQQALQERLDEALRHDAEKGAALARARAELERLQSESSKARVDSLAEVFRSRGLVGEDESVAALRALLDARRFMALQELLEVSDPSAALYLLRSQLALHCGREDCPTPQGLTLLRVSPERCEVCGGSDIRRGLRRFSEALMLEALLRVVIVGGSPSYHRMLRDGVDKRVDIRLVAGDARRTRSQAQADLSWAQLVIIWGGTILDHKVSELYQDSQARTLRIANRGLSGLLDQATRALTTTSP